MQRDCFLLENEIAIKKNIKILNTNIHIFVEQGLTALALFLLISLDLQIMSKFEKAELVLKLLIAIGAGVLIWEWFEIIH